MFMLLIPPCLPATYEAVYSPLRRMRGIMRGKFNIMWEISNSSPTSSFEFCCSTIRNFCEPRYFILTTLSGIQLIVTSLPGVRVVVFIQSEVKNLDVNEVLFLSSLQYVT